MIAVLPKHQPWDYEIKLQPGTEPGFGPIYQLSEKELQVLCEYLEENLKKSFIQESQSPAGYPILKNSSQNHVLQGPSFLTNTTICHMFWKTAEFLSETTQTLR